ncbi:PAS domain S-box protein [Spirosoma fluviale]|uniref:histidine kinase n=1 Tax=Spirosoma fluviale TaxID=1597977 RepID=A0A286GBD6_9BACT|nr:PAS domain S-box protein [Spirosoma fluviale]SOD92820.1 PAS domain S-box-containing protein [Spirosoma fluviale]
METHLELWFDTSVEGVAFLKPVYRESESSMTFHCQRVNKTLAQLLGRTADEFIGQLIDSFIPWIPQAELTRQLVTVLQTGEPQQGQYYYPQGNCWFSVSLTRLADLVVIRFLAVSEHREATGQPQPELRSKRRVMGVNRPRKTRLTRYLSEQQQQRLTLQRLFKRIPCEEAILFQLDQSGQLFDTEVHYRHGVQHEGPAISLPIRYRHHSLLAQGQEVLINQLEEEMPGFPPDVNPYRRGHRSFLGLPLLVDAKLVGILALLDPTPNFFTPDYVRIGQEVASQLASLFLRQAISKQSGNLSENNQLLQAIINTSPTSLCLLRPVWQEKTITDFRAIISNAQSVNITGLDQDTLLTKSLLTLFPHFLTNGVFAKMVTVALTGETQRFQLADNLATGPFWGDFSLVQVAGDVLFSVNDITRLKQVEEELRTANLELEQRVIRRTAEVRQLAALQGAILKYVGVGVAATDTNGIIQLINPALEAMTGYRADELVGQRTTGSLREPVLHQQQLDQLKRDLADEAGEGEDIVARYVAQHNFLRLENTLLTKDGRMIPVLSTVSGLYDEQNVLMGYVDISTDISYLKAIEEALMQASQRSQLATKAAKLGVWEWNLLTHELILDENFYALLSIPQRTALARISDVEPLLHPDDLTFFSDKVQAIIREQQPFEVEFRTISPIDESVRYMKIDGLVLQNESGLSHRMIGVIRDRTAKRLANQALRASEQRYRSLVDHLSDVVFQADSKGLWTYLNPAWEIVTGFSIEESLGRFFLDFIVTEDHSKVRAIFPPIEEGQEESVRQVIRYVYKTGGYRWVEAFAQVSRNQHQEITGVTGTLTDITERKMAEEAILESEQRFREIAENVDEMFWIRDINSPVFLYMNPVFETYSGIPVEQLYENPLIFANVIVEEDRPAIVNAFMSSEPKSTFQFRFHHPDGSIRWLNARVFLINDKNGVPTRRLGVATDVTTAIEKEQILKESLAKERALNALKSQFITTASHEFRTPLAAIISSVELIKFYAAQENRSVANALIDRHVDSISKQVMSLTDLIADTLVLSSLEEGKIPVQLEAADIVDLTDTLLALNFGNREDNRQVALEVIGSPVLVNIDKKLMAHVLTNLVSNAFKFSATNPRLTIRFEKEAVFISVIDQGIGIPRKDLPHLFGKFFRASNADHIKGTGLGLSICLEYITLQNGSIDIASIEGAGTTFTVILPNIGL